MLDIEKKKQFILKHKHPDVKNVIDCQRHRIEADTCPERINKIFNQCIRMEREFNEMKQHSEIETKENIIDMLSDELTEDELQQLEEYL